MNPFISKITFLFLLISFASFAQKKDSIKIDSLAKKYSGQVSGIVNKAVKDTLIKKKAEKKKSDFHFFADVFGKVDSTKRKKLPKIAIYRSLILPGWGQATNKQYLIIPIIGAGVAGAIYALKFNNEKYQFYKGYLELVVHDPTTYPKGINIDVNGTTLGPFTADQITPAVNGFRRNRDLTYIAFAAGWLLQAIQANVAAHLKTFDMSDNISMKFEPNFQITPFGSAVGGSIKLYIK